LKRDLGFQTYAGPNSETNDRIMRLKLRTVCNNPADRQSRLQMKAMIVETKHSTATLQLRRPAEHFGCDTFHSFFGLEFEM